MKSILLLPFILLRVLVNAQDHPELAIKQLNQFLNVRDFTISKTEDEAYFTVQSPDQKLSQIASIKKENGQWGNPVLLEFCDSFTYLEPFLSPNNKQLYFVSDRPIQPNGKRKDFDIWMVKRKKKTDSWSDPINLGAPVNTDLNEFYPTVSQNKNLYFTLDSPNGLGKDDIYFAEWNGKSYSTPTLLDSNINSPGYEFNAFISPKEDFILFSKYNAKGGFGSGDLYISKKKDGLWQTSKNLGPNFNSKYMDYCPFYHQETNTLYFTSKRIDLKTKTFKTLSEFQSYTKEHANGLSKVFKVKVLF